MGLSYFLITFKTGVFPNFILGFPIMSITLEQNFLVDNIVFILSILLWVLYPRCQKLFIGLRFYPLYVYFHCRNFSQKFLET